MIQHQTPADWLKAKLFFSKSRDVVMGQVSEADERLVKMGVQLSEQQLQSSRQKEERGAGIGKNGVGPQMKLGHA